MLQRWTAATDLAWAQGLGDGEALRAALEALGAPDVGEERPPDHGHYLWAFALMFRACFVNNPRYKDSWCRRGQQGIFHNIARKFDRMEAQVLAGQPAAPNETMDLAVYSWMHVAWHLRNHPEALRAWAEHEGYVEPGV